MSEMYTYAHCSLTRMQSHMHVQAHTLFSLFVLVFLYIFREEKFFIEGFFTKDYIQGEFKMQLSVKHFRKNMLLISFLK